MHFDGAATTFAVLASIILLSALRIRLRDAARIRRLGGKAPSVPHQLPLGLDLTWRVITHMKQCTFIDYTRELLRVPGRTVELKMTGSRLILSDHPENMRTIMMSRDFGKGHIHHEIFKNIFGDSVFSAEGDHWVTIKNFLRPHVSQIRPRDLLISEEHVQRMFHRIRLRSSPNGIELYDIMDRLQMDIATHVFFGESTNSLDSDTVPFRDSLAKLMHLNSVRLSLGRIALLFSDCLLAPADMKVVQQYMDSLVDRSLGLAKEHVEDVNSGRQSLSDSLAMNALSRKFIKDQLISVLMAGKDPVSILISWAVFELSRRPEMAKRLQDELHAGVGFDSPPTFQQIQALTLLQNVAKETMRMYHPLGINVREARKDTCLPRGGGHDGTQPVAILKGERVAISVLGIQRHRSIVPGSDPDEWDPDRWEGWKPAPDDFVPFNIGPRICLGRSFGQLQLQYTLARLLQEYRTIEWCGYGEGIDSSEPMRFKIELNTKMDKPIWCRFTPRKSA
ncbi:cytochrome P450 [Thozetella sp. PMI_491]|nr:cytochrome P450 [Thozetella sp. PMI_491]